MSDVRLGSLSGFQVTSRVQGKGTVYDLYTERCLLIIFWLGQVLEQHAIRVLSGWIVGWLEIQQLIVVHVIDL